MPIRQNMQNGCSKKPKKNSVVVWKTNVIKLPASIALASTPKWFVTPNKKETTNV